MRELFTLKLTVKFDVVTFEPLFVYFHRIYHPMFVERNRPMRSQILQSVIDGTSLKQFHNINKNNNWTKPKNSITHLMKQRGVYHRNFQFRQTNS